MADTLPADDPAVAAVTIGGPPPQQRGWRYAHAGAYLRFVRRADAITAAGGFIRIHWNDAPMDIHGWRREKWAALEKRINAKMGPPPRWRKLDERYQVDLRRDALDLENLLRRRIRIYQLRTPELARRFGHLLARRDD